MFWIECRINFESLNLCFLPGLTSAPEVKFVHRFSTMHQKLVLLVNLAMIRGTSYFVLL